MNIFCFCLASEEKRREAEREQLQSKFRKLFKDQSQSDVVLVCGEHEESEDNEFPAHKCILAVSSPVFEGMFKSGMRENVS